MKRWKLYLTAALLGGILAGCTSNDDGSNTIWGDVVDVYAESGSMPFMFYQKRAKTAGHRIQYEPREIVIVNQTSPEK